MTTFTYKGRVYNSSNNFFRPKYINYIPNFNISR